MSFGDGNLRERIAAAEAASEEKDALVRDMIDALRRAAVEADGLEERARGLGIEPRDGQRPRAAEAVRPDKAPAPGEASAIPPFDPLDCLARESVAGKRVFLSGPMTGYRDWNRAAFAEAEALVRSLGASGVYNPAAAAPAGPDPLGHEHWMMKTLHDLTGHEAGPDGRNRLSWDVGLMLAGWRESDGARLEMQVLAACGAELYEEAGIR